MVRFYDRIIRDGLVDTDTDELASAALNDLRSTSMPVLVVDNAVDLWFSNQIPRTIDIVLPYVPTMFIEGRFRPSFKAQLPGGMDGAPDEIGMIALRTDLWETMGPVPALEDRGAVAADLVTQRIADSPAGLFIPIEQRAAIDPVRWMVDFHLFVWNVRDTALPKGPVVSLTAFLAGNGRFARDMNEAPMLLSLVRPVEADIERAGRIWVDALLFGLSLGWCQNVTVIETESPEKMRQAFRRRHSFLPCDPMVLALDLGASLREDIEANVKPELSLTRLDFRPGAFVPTEDGGSRWAVAPVPVAANGAEPVK